MWRRVPSALPVTLLFLNLASRDAIFNTMNRVNVVIALLLLTLAGCQSPERDFDPNSLTEELLVDRIGGVSRTVPVREFAKLGALPVMQTLDPLFGEEREYQGLDLEQLQKLADAQPQDRVLRFHCRDGYVSEVEVEVLQQGQFLLAFRDLKAAPEAWVPYPKMSYLQSQPLSLKARLDKAESTGEEHEALKKEYDKLKTLARDMANLKNQGPFYPIFVPDPSLPQDRVWSPPFCVDAVTFAPAKIDRSVTQPEGLAEDHPVWKGARLFQQRCATCHAINGVGGQVGPELNRPLAVTEYWDESALRQLLKDPSKVRENSKMPPLNLPDPMIEDLLAYLRWMGKEKKISVK